MEARFKAICLKNYFFRRRPKQDDRLSSNPQSNRRDDTEFRMEGRWEKHQLVPHSDANSWVDSGAGDSISETELEKSPIIISHARQVPLIKKPSFRTFVDDIDERCSIEIFDANQFVPSYYS